MITSDRTYEECCKQISATLNITEQTFCILRNLYEELGNYYLLSLIYLKKLIDIQLSDLQNKYQEYNLCLDEHDEKNSNIVVIQSNELFQLNISIRLQLKGELQKCEKDINKGFLNKLLQELNKYDESNGKEQRKYQYRKLLEIKIDKSKFFCYSIQFNTSSTIVFTGYQDGKIRVHGFNKIYKLIQTFSNKNFDKELIWIKQSNQLVIGCEDQSIVVWEHCWNSYQKLQGHKKTISCLILNQKEDLLISGSHDKTIKFWKNINSIWSLQQTIDVQIKLYCLSLNTSEEKLICCGYQNALIILELVSNQQWVITQQIPVKKCGLHLSFVDNNSFIFQPLNQYVLEVYNFQEDKNKFFKVKQIQFISGPDYSGSFKIQIIQEKNLIIVKYHWYVIVIKYNQKWDYYIQQVIKFQHYWIWGNKTENGQFLVTWDASTHKVWMLNCLK